MYVKTLITILAACSMTANGLVIPDLQSLFSFELLSKTGQGAKDLIQQHPLLGVEHKDDHLFNLAPIVNSDNGKKQIIPNRYIVVYKDELTAEDKQHHQIWIQNTIDIFNTSDKLDAKKVNLDYFDFLDNNFSGYFGYLTPELVSLIQQDSRIKFIEPDSVFKVNEFEVQKDVTWGLSRISHRELSPKLDYLYDNDGGKGVVAYVIDTGIKIEHEEFENRATWGSAVAFPNLKIDGHGHGTHCAGTIGSKTYGIAKQVELVAVGVMNFLGSGTTSDIIKGIEFAVLDHQNNAKSKKGFKGSTVNMSIGGGASDALDLAANAAVKAGLHLSVAAGNENQDASLVSPARASGPITVGATDSSDRKAEFSNWGKAVDIFAPGVDIESTFIWSDTTVMSGTSMAAPHITGLLSYYLSLYPEQTSEYATGLLDPATLKSKLIKYSTKGLITGLDAGSPNALAFNGGGANLSDFWS
ncbi:peptidase S8/S53 domain-containing protein [Scheffersomyces coipomensis]|uniref:peptidase S8/S53 domain-containing protein n=1 Tax=Scheffersomyces coipomensis TaxID=1788519 RepID=UPI00315DFEBC